MTDVVEMEVKVKVSPPNACAKTENFGRIETKGLGPRAMAQA